MTFNPTKMQLRITSISMLVIALIAVGLAVLLPPGTEEQTFENSPLRQATSVPASQPDKRDAVDFSDLMDVALRKPLALAHPATGPVTAGGDSTAGLKLIGTILEPDHTCAIFMNESGKTEIKSVGGKVGLADIASITGDSVTIRSNGRSIVLHAVRPPGMGGMNF